MSSEPGARGEDGADDAAGRRAHADGDSTIVVATIERPASRTGSHAHVRQLLDHLQRSGVPADLVTPYSRSVLLSAPIFGARLALDGLSEPLGMLWYYHWHEVFLKRALRARLAALGPAVVYAQGPRAARAALRARRARQRVVMVVHFQGSEAEEWATNGRIPHGGRAYWAIRRVERRVAAHVDGIVYVSEAARRAFVDWVPDAAQVPTAVISNFVDPLDATPPGDPHRDLVTVGRLEPIKNHGYLLEVLAAAERAGRCYTLDVFGDGSLARRLTLSARHLGVEDRVRFLGHRSDVRRRLPAYRAYVHASLRESQSLAIIEAQAAGLPVVTADVGGVRSVCGDGAGSRFWPLDDADRAARILIDLLDDEAARSRAAAASLARFRDAFATDAVAPRLCDFLMGPSPGSTRAEDGSILAAP